MVTPSFFKNRCTRFLSLSRIPSKGRAVTTCPTCRLLLRKTPTATAAKLMMRVSGSKGRSRCSCAIKLANTLSCGLIIVASVVQGGFCVATIVAVPGCGGYTLLNCGLTSTVPQSGPGYRVVQGNSLLRHLQGSLQVLRVLIQLKEPLQRVTVSQPSVGRKKI